METQTLKHGGRDAEIPAVAGERVLRVLGMTQRPLEWSELQRALGLQSHEFQPAWEWLLDNGYVSPTALATGATATLQEGEHYLSIISSDTIETIQEQFDLSKPTKVMLRGVHASTEITQTVDFGAVVSGELSSALIEGVEPASASAEAGIAVNPGTVVLGAATT